MAKKSNALKPGQISKLLAGAFKDVNKLFWKELRSINIVQIIKNIILKGIIPVEGFGGRFQSYSESYLGIIKGTKKKKGKPTPKPGLKSTMGKKVSPVNLKLSGEMLEALKFDASTGTLKADHELWVFHNEGMGKLPVRRLLPNQDGEKFNRRIQQNITEALLKAIGVGNKGKNFVTVKFNIK